MPGNLIKFIHSINWLFLIKFLIYLSWAFAVTGALESFSLIYANQNVSFSEQNLVDCVGLGDCDGGFPDLGLNYFLNTGLMYSTSYGNWTNSVCIIFF
jgi:hypothetical protein